MRKVLVAGLLVALASFLPASAQLGHFGGGPRTIAVQPTPGAACSNSVYPESNIYLALDTLRTCRCESAIWACTSAGDVGDLTISGSEITGDTGVDLTLSPAAGQSVVVGGDEVKSEAALDLPYWIAPYASNVVRIGITDGANYTQITDAGSISFAGAATVTIPSGASRSLTVDGHLYGDETDGQLQLQLDGTDYALSPRTYLCIPISNITEAYADVHLFAPPRAVTLKEGWCICQGDCTIANSLTYWQDPDNATPVQISTNTSNQIDCDIPGSAVVSTLTTNSDFAATEVLEFDVVDITPDATNTTDDYLVCFSYVEDPS